MLIRIIDIVLSLMGLIVAFPFLIILLIVGFWETGSPLFLQVRVGKNKEPFTLCKLRTMKVGTASVASHLAESSSITNIGLFLRKTKLDEIPQLWNVLIGEMSLVGPRPNLFNQEEVIKERDKQGVYSVRPGITGLAQINNVDMSKPHSLANLDAQMIESLSVGNYFVLIVKTLTGKGQGDAIK